MRIDNLARPIITGNWTHNDIIVPENLNWNNQHAMCNHFQPSLSVNINTVSPLYEATYKELASLIDGNFLNQKVRADELEGVDYIGFRPDNVMNFYVKSSEFDDNRIRYTNSVLFNEWDEIGSDQDLDFNERARMLLWVGNIKLHCTCPSFLYHAYQYLLNVLDAAIYPEERKGVIRNPQDRGIVCKHMNRVLRVLPFHSGYIATDLKKQFGI